MSAKNAEEQIRIATEEFEEQYDYEDPFKGASGQGLIDIDKIDEASIPPHPVSAQTKPQSALPYDTDEEEESAPKRSKKKGKGTKKEPNADKVPSRKKEPRMPETPKDALSEGAKTTVGGAQPRKEGSIANNKDEPSLGSGNEDGKSDPVTGDRSTDTVGSAAVSPPRPSRRSSELSPFALTQSRVHGMVQRTGSSSSGVRIGGVASPPASDAASIAGKREDEEDPLDESLGDPEDLMETLEKKERVAIRTRTPTRSPPKSSHARAGSVLAGGSTQGIDSVVANSHEIRIMALEKQVASLTERNQILVDRQNELVDKTDALIKEVSRIRVELRSELIMEMNERMKRVGGPAPTVTITSPSPTVPSMDAAHVPSNVHSSSASSVSPISAQDNSASNLTGEALRRYLRRQRMQS